MLQWEWPRVWSGESREAVRAALERALRAAMAGGDETQVRGVVCVDVPHLGTAPPQLALVDVRVVSLTHTTVTVRCRYAGDFAVTLRGLQINLDTVGGGRVDDGDATLALPFFCPFEMTLCDLVLDGTASIDVYHDVARTAMCAADDNSHDRRNSNGSSSSSSSSHCPHPLHHHHHQRTPRQQHECVAGNDGDKDSDDDDDDDGGALAKGATRTRADGVSRTTAQATTAASSPPPPPPPTSLAANATHGQAPSTHARVTDTSSSSLRLRSSSSSQPAMAARAELRRGGGGSSSSSRSGGGNSAATTTTTRRLHASVSSPGYGILAAVGGRRGMRHPLHTSDGQHSDGRVSSVHATQPQPTASDKGGRCVAPPPPPPSSSSAARVDATTTTGLGVVDVCTGAAALTQRRVKVQLFGNPLKHFRVVSNFSTVPGVNARVEETIRQLVKPAIEHMMSTGVTFAL